MQESGISFQQKCSKVNLVVSAQHFTATIVRDVAMSGRMI
jgi:hypothetical protein